MDEVSAKVDIEVKDETIRSVVDATLDVFSGPTELLGWLGDSIRIHRARSALRCILKTKELADECGVELKAPPIKFIAQYIENASLEDETDEKLIEWWARLLLDAGKAFDDKHVFYANVLKQVSARELELLEVIVRNGRRDYRLAQASEAEFVHDFQFNEDDLLLTSELNKESAQDAVNSIISVFEIPGVLVLDIFIDDSDSNQWQESHPDYMDEELAAWQILQSLQLVRIDYKKFQREDTHYRIRLAMLTHLGGEFYFSCHDEEMRDARSEATRYKRYYSGKS